MCGNTTLQPVQKTYTSFTPSLVVRNLDHNVKYLDSFQFQLEIGMQVKSHALRVDDRFQQSKGELPIHKQWFCRRLTIAPAASKNSPKFILGIPLLMSHSTFVPLSLLG